ncbi:MAG: hypothetical protein WA530_20125 [Candidatus Acidiferrum sp.]
MKKRRLAAFEMTVWGGGGRENGEKRDPSTARQREALTLRSG